VIFITPAESDEYISEIPNLFECLLEILSPVEKSIYTFVPNIYSNDMCMVIQKPGSLLCALTEEMWMRSGRKAHEMDPSFTLIVNLSESPTVFSTELFSLPPEIES
jgi:hypothetical protein